MKKVICSALLFLSVLPVSMATLAGTGYQPPAMPPCIYNPVPGCIGAMPDSGGSGSPSPIVRYETTAKSTTGQFAISQPNGAQSWKNSYAKVGVITNLAEEECRSKDSNCTALLEFKGTCASLVSGGFRQANDGQSLFIATGKTQAQATTKATAQCQANSKGNCQVQQALCTSFYSSTQGYRF